MRPSERGSNGASGLCSLRRQYLAHRPQADPEQQQQFAERRAAEPLELGDTGVDERVPGVMPQRGSAAQQVGGVADTKPSVPLFAVARQAVSNLLHHQQLSILRIAAPTGQGGQSARAHALDEALRRVPPPACAGHPAQPDEAATRAHPGPKPAVALIQFIQQQAPNAGQFMHMLMAVEESRRIADRLFEGRVARESRPAGHGGRAAPSSWPRSAPSVRGGIGTAAAHR